MGTLNLRLEQNWEIYHNFASEIFRCSLMCGIAVHVTLAYTVALELLNILPIIVALPCPEFNVSC